jgi:hypothetical protein
MAIWFAPALVMFARSEAGRRAQSTSFAGGLKNIPAFLIYGIVGLVLATVATILYCLDGSYSGRFAIASAYTGYRDIFTEPTA